MPPPEDMVEHVQDLAVGVVRSNAGIPIMIWACSVGRLSTMSRCQGLLRRRFAFGWLTAQEQVTARLLGRLGRAGGQRLR